VVGELNKRFLLGFSIIVLEPLIFLGLGQYCTSYLEPCCGSLSINIASNMNEVANFSAFVYARDSVNISRVCFHNDSVTFDVIENHSQIYLKTISDCSGIELYVKDWRPQERICFRVEGIYVSPDFPLNLTSIRLVINPSTVPENISYDMIFSVFAKTRLGVLPVASQRTFNYESQNITYRRAKVLWLFDVFFLLIFLASLYLPLYILFPTFRSKFPYVTLGLVIIAVFIYAFFGSGWEIISAFSKSRSQIIIYPISFLLHGYDNHLIGNLFYFIPLSLLMEGWLKLRSETKTFVIWYVVPLLMTLFSPGIGLSLSIESMTWALWARIILFQQVKTKVDKLFTLLSALPSFVFVEWTYRYVFTNLSGYDKMLAENHVYYGLATLILIFVACLVWNVRRRGHKKVSNF